MNFAAVQKLPLVVIAEDNKYAYSTPTSQQMAISRIDLRADAWDSARDDRRHRRACRTSLPARGRSCAGRRGPTLIGVDVMRMKGHAEHDDQRYVPKALLDEWRARPAREYRGWLIAEGVASGTDLDEIDAMSHGYAEDEAQLADNAPMPDPADVGPRRVGGRRVVPPRLELVKSPFAEV